MRAFLATSLAFPEKPRGKNETKNTATREEFASVCFISVKSNETAFCLPGPLEFLRPPNRCVNDRCARGRWRRCRRAMTEARRHLLSGWLFGWRRGLGLVSRASGWISIIRQGSSLYSGHNCEHRPLRLTQEPCSLPYHIGYDHNLAVATTSL